MTFRQSRLVSVVGALLALTVACAKTTGTQPVLPAPVVAPPPPPPPPVVPVLPPPDTTHIRDFGFWLDARTETQAFTSFRTIHVDLDADPSEWSAQVADESRAIVWFVSPFYYTRTARSANGYVYRDDFAQRWQAVLPLIRLHLAQTRAIWLVDEPDSAAWGDRPAGVPYDPNLYNGDITRAATIIRADLPTMAIGVNYSDADPALEIAAGVTLVGLEVYRDDWPTRVARLEAKTPAPLWLLTAAFADPTWTTDDTVLAQRARDQWAAAQRDSRIVGFYPFLWCCDDTTTGDKAFYTVGGVAQRLPQTLAVLQEMGRQVRR